MKCKLHPFIALPFHVVVWQELLAISIRNRDNISGLVNTALEFTFISTWIGIRILWIKAVFDFAISSLTKSAIGTVATIYCIKESFDLSVTKLV